MTNRFSNQLTLAGVALAVFAAAPAFAATPSLVEISLEANAAAWASQPITAPISASDADDLTPAKRDFASVPAMLQRPLSRVASDVVLALADGSGVSLSLTRLGQLDCILYPVAAAPVSFAQSTPVKLEATPESLGPIAMHHASDEEQLGHLLD